jgi:hypothetical protein
MKDFDLGLWDPAGTDNTTESVRWGDRRLHRGDRVRLRPRRRADIMDIALDGRTAVVESIERDYEDVVHVAVLVDDDPGKDLGAMRQPGHRFFFSLEDIEAVERLDHGGEEPS